MSLKKFGNIICNIIFYGLLAVFIIISAIMLKARNNNEQPSILGNKFFIVLTGSMTPTINAGDLVVVNEVNPEDIKKDDVITFGSDYSDNITTHRVKEIINEDGYIRFVTQGDANNVEDPIAVEAEVLLGRVSKIIPKIGSGILWIQKNIIFVLIGLIVVIIFSILLDKFKVKIIKGKIKNEEKVLEK